MQTATQAQTAPAAIVAANQPTGRKLKGQWVINFVGITKKSGNHTKAVIRNLIEDDGERFGLLFPIGEPVARADDPQKIIGFKIPVGGGKTALLRPGIVFNEPVVEIAKMRNEEGDLVDIPSWMGKTQNGQEQVWDTCFLIGHNGIQQPVDSGQRAAVLLAGLAL